MPAFAALADGTRVQIVEALTTRDRDVSELVDLFPISQPAISRHLRILREAGVVEATADGKRRVYRLQPAAIAEVTDWATKCTRTWQERFDALGDHLDNVKRERRGQ